MDSTVSGIVTDGFKEWKLREMASYALNILSHEDYRVSEDLLEEGKLEKLLPLLGGGTDVPVELLLNIIQIFIGISANEKYRETIISEGVVKPIMDLIQVLILRLRIGTDLRGFCFSRISTNLISNRRGCK